MADEGFEKTAELHIDDKVVTLPVIEGTEGDRAIDISNLLRETGCITLDTGYVNTGSCVSEITYLDGKAGILRYRGYDIEDLAANCSFLEVAYLLLHNKLPNYDELENFKALISRFALIHEDMIHFFDHFPAYAPPMSILSVMVNVSVTSILRWMTNHGQL